MKVDAVTWQGQPAQICTQVMWASLPSLHEWGTSATHDHTEFSRTRESPLSLKVLLYNPECGLLGVESLPATSTAGFSFCSHGHPGGSYYPLCFTNKANEAGEGQQGAPKPSDLQQQCLL